MNRRSLLKALLALPAAPLVAKVVAKPTTKAVSVTLGDMYYDPYGDYQLVHLINGCDGTAGDVVYWWPHGDYKVTVMNVYDEDMMKRSAGVLRSNTKANNDCWIQVRGGTQTLAKYDWDDYTFEWKPFDAFKDKP